MANKRPPITFTELDPPKGRNAILRSQKEVAAEQAALEAEENGNQEINNSGEPENFISSNKENQKTGKPENRAEYPKATYRLSSEAIEALEDMKRMLRRTYKSKVILEEIVEAAILEIYHDLVVHKETSFLVNKFPGKQENNKS